MTTRTRTTEVAVVTLSAAVTYLGRLVPNGFADEERLSAVISKLNQAIANGKSGHRTTGSVD